VRKQCLSFEHRDCANSHKHYMEAVLLLILSFHLWLQPH